MIDLRILPNCLLLRPARGIPLDRLRPVVIHAGRVIKPHMGERRVSGDDASDDGRPSLIVPTDLRPFAADKHARLQVWADGFRLLDTPLFAGGGAVAGAIEGVTDFCVTGWAAHVLGERLPAGELFIDDVSHGRFVADVGRRDLGGLVPLASAAGFSVPLPAIAVDGAAHEIAVGFERSRLAPVTFRTRPRFRVEHAAGDGVRLWFYDAAQADGPVTITLRDAAGTVVHRGLTHPRGDTGEATGRWHTGFGVSFATGLPDRRLDICAGAGGSLVFAGVEVATPQSAMTALREAAGALLQLEQAIGRPLAWPRGLIAEMRAAGTLDQALGHSVGRTLGVVGRQVSVVVPIYKGVAETAACLASLRAAMAGGDEAIAEVLLLDDASPDPEMAALLASETTGVFRSVRNEANLGFVGTANRGLTLADPDCDVILLNSDTIVPAGFAARLRAAAHASPRIASATPLSNDATVLGVPRRDERNGLRPEDAPRLDALLRARPGPRAVDVPVGVGFCLYLKREAIDDVGALDPVWGRGYCEEVDWCLRARDRGWTHVAAVDTYVHHASSVSFGIAERTALMARNHALLEARYPDFVPQLRAFLIADPVGPARMDVFCAELARAAAPCLLHLTHALGGGTGVLVERYAAAFAASGGNNLICTTHRDPWLDAEVDDVTWREAGLSLRLPAGGLAVLLERVATLGLPQVRALVHSLIGASPAVRALPVPYAVTVHDYQWICPRVTLVDQTERFCGLPEVRYCQLCVRANGTYAFGAEGDALIASDLPAWLAQNRALLDRAVAVVAPSADTAARLGSRLGLHHVRVMAHPEAVPAARLTRGPDASAMTRVAVVGGINIAKGMGVLRDLAAHIDQTGAAVRLKLFGEVSVPADFTRTGAIEIAGRYAPPDLAGLLEAYHPHVVFFPAVWPETYCFVLSEVWAAGYPAAAFDLGAIAARIRETGGGVVLPFDPDPAALLPRLIAARDALARLEGHLVEIGSPWTDDDPMLERVFSASGIPCPPAEPSTGPLA